MSTPEEERLRAGIRRLIATGRGLSKGAEKTLRELIGEPKVSVRPKVSGSVDAVAGNAARSRD